MGAAILFKPVAGILYNSLSSSFLIYHLIIFAGCAALLLVPTIFMGATLPVLSAFYVSRFERLGSQAGRLYGLNTVGAALGSLVSGFVLIRVLGMNGTLALAVGLNAFIGLGAMYLGRSLIAGTDVPAQKAGEESAAASPGDHAPSYPVWLALGMFTISGFCGMACQVIWTRLLGLIVGPTTYSFTIVVTSFILGLAIGCFIFGYLADRVRIPLKLLIYSQAGAALATVLVSHLLGNSQIFFAKLIARFQDQFILLATLKILVLFSFFIIPTILFGAAFPLVLKIITPSLRRVGRTVGIATALNTSGAVVGAFAAGFLLIPLLGKESGIRFIASLQLAAAFASGVVLFRSRVSAQGWMPLNTLALAGLASIEPQTATAPEAVAG